MWRHYVYMHCRADTGAPFYVGKGSHRAREKIQSFERAHARDGRNIFWTRVVNKYGVQVVIVASCQSDAGAQALEMSLIADIGRRDLGRGPLVNVTDGGDGHAGIIASPELRAKRSINGSGPRSEAWVSSIRRARKNGGNGGVVKRGDRLPDAWRKSLSRSKIGSKNPSFGKPTAVARKVVNKDTGEVYESISRAAVALGVNAKTLYQYLDGTRPNRTALARL